VVRKFGNCFVRLGRLISLYEATIKLRPGWAEGGDVGRTSKFGREGMSWKTRSTEGGNELGSSFDDEEELTSIVSFSLPGAGVRSYLTGFPIGPYE